MAFTAITRPLSDIGFGRGEGHGEGRTDSESLDGRAVGGIGSDGVIRWLITATILPEKSQTEIAIARPGFDGEGDIGIGVARLDDDALRPIKVAGSKHRPIQKRWGASTSARQPKQVYLIIHNGWCSLTGEESYGEFQILAFSVSVFGGG